MPSAVPVPRGPSVLLLGSADGLFAAPGCPACRYTAESSQTYLTWFALESHADPDVLQRLCASRGMCARHTRRLLVQPGAPARLTAVYRYVVAAAARNPIAEPAVCPACEQEKSAGDRVLSALVEELATGRRAQYKEHGGLCLPHLRRAVRIGRNMDVRWVIRFMIARLGVPYPDLDLLTGGMDQDADDRASLRAGLPARLPAGVCPVCWRAADCERRRLAELATIGADWPALPSPPLLCVIHLRTAPSPGAMAARQAALEAERLVSVLDGKPRLLGFAPRRLSPRARRALAEPDCPLCRDSKLAAADQLSLPGAGTDDPRAPGWPLLCIRHAVVLRAFDPAAARRAADRLTERGREIVTQLDKALARQTPAERAPELPREVSTQQWSGWDGTGRREAGAWRRAAVYLDGSVFGGCPAEMA
jgi:hypothetical protein